MVRLPLAWIAAGRWRARGARVARLVAGAKYVNGPETVTAHSVVPPVSRTVNRVGWLCLISSSLPGTYRFFFICSQNVPVDTHTFNGRSARKPSVITKKKTTSSNTRGENFFFFLIPFLTKRRPLTNDGSRPFSNYVFGFVVPSRCHPNGNDDPPPIDSFPWKCSLFIFVLSARYPVAPSNRPGISRRWRYHTLVFGTPSPTRNPRCRCCGGFCVI